MLSKLIFCAFLAAALTGASDGAEYNQQAPSISPQFLDLPSFDTKNIVGQPTTINHKSFIEHISSGTGSSSESGGSSRHYTTRTRSSTLLNKAIAGQGAYPVILPSSSNDAQATPPNFSNVPAEIYSNNYASSGILSEGLFGSSVDKAVGPYPSILSLNSRIDHSTSGRISTVPNGIPSLNSNKEGILSTGFLSTPFDKRNVPAPEFISVSVSSSIDDGIPSSPVKVPTVNFANNRILSTGQLGTSLAKDAISIPNAVSTDFVNGRGAPGSVSAVPVKFSSSVGPAESSFFSSIDSGTPVSIPSSPVKVPTVNYANNGILSTGQLGTSLAKDVVSIPNAVSTNFFNGYGTPGSVSSVPVKVSSSLGPAQSSFFFSINEGLPVSIPSSPVKVPTVNYANNGILSTGQLGTSLAKDVVSIPNAVSTDFVNGYGTPGSVSSVPVKVSSSLGPAQSSFFSSISEGLPVSIPSSPVKVPTVNYANNGILSTGQLGTSLAKDVVSIPNAVSTNFVNGYGAPGSVSAVPVKVSSSVGPAQSSFLSSVGGIVEKASTVSMPDSIYLQKIAAAQNEVPSVNYAADKVLAGPVVGQSTSSNPTALTSHSSIDKYLSTPASDLLGFLGNRYNNNQNGILSSGFLGAPISLVFGLTGKEISTDGLFSASKIANNGNLGGGFASVPSVGNKEDPLNKFETVIQHAAPANAAAPTTFSGINNNNLNNGLIGNGIFADPLGFSNGLFGNSYNGINGIGGGNFGAENIFSKYLWR